MPEPTAWVDSALCAQTDPEIFTPEPGGSNRDAKRICSSCPVSLQCLEWAQQNEKATGIYGGLSPKERRALRRAAAS